MSAPLTKEAVRALREQIAAHEREERQKAHRLEKAHHEARLAAANRYLEKDDLRLADRANGCWGILCIQRDVSGEGGKVVEHWSDSANTWGAFGTPYNGVCEALGRAVLLLEAPAGT